MLRAGAERAQPSAAELIVDRRQPGCPVERNQRIARAMAALKARQS
jgi:hypothetical protein